MEDRNAITSEPITVTHEFLRSRLIEAIGDNIRDLITQAAHIVNVHTCIPQLIGTQPSLYRRRPSEINLMDRIIKHHSQDVIDPDEQDRLDWECFRRWQREDRMDWIQNTFDDDRLIRMFKSNLELCLEAKQEPRVIESVIQDFIGYIQQVNPTKAKEWQQWQVTFMSHLNEKRFQIHWTRAMDMQHKAPQGSCLVNLDRLVECRAAFKRIHGLSAETEADFCDDIETKTDYLRAFRLTLKRIIPRVCPEMNTTSDIEQILKGCSAVWDGERGRLGEEWVDRAMRIWLLTLIDHIATFEAIDQHADYLAGVIYQMRKVLDRCLNRVWHEWHQVVMLYWNHVFDDAEERMDWIALRWKQDFLSRQLQARVTGGINAARIELEYYRNNEVIHDAIFHFGMIHRTIAYRCHHTPGTVISLDDLLKAFFKELHQLTQTSPNGWVDHAINTCPSTRTQHGMARSVELTISRLERWLAGDGTEGDLKPLLYEDKVDYWAAQQQLSHCMGRRILGREFKPLKPHVCSLRRLLVAYVDMPSYLETEAHILKNVLEMREHDMGTERGLELHKDIICQVRKLHEAHEATLRESAELKILDRAHQLQTLKVKA